MTASGNLTFAQVQALKDQYPDVYNAVMAPAAQEEGKAAAQAGGQPPPPPPPRLPAEEYIAGVSAVPDHWRTLGIPESEMNTEAAKSQLRKAFKRLMWDLHPDRNCGDDACVQATQRVTLAYTTFSNATDLDQYLKRVRRTRRKNGGVEQAAALQKADALKRSARKRVAGIKRRRSPTRSSSPSSFSHSQNSTSSRSPSRDRKKAKSGWGGAVAPPEGAEPEQMFAAIDDIVQQIARGLHNEAELVDFLKEKYNADRRNRWPLQFLFPEAGACHELFNKKLAKAKRELDHIRRPALRPCGDVERAAGPQTPAKWRENTAKWLKSLPTKAAPRLRVLL